MIRRHWPIALATALAASGCVTPGTPKPTPAPSAEGVLGARQAATATLTGVVMAPTGVISAGGANVVSAGGANVIAAGGANVVSAGGLNWRTLSIAETPLADVEVYLADAAGQPVARLPRVRTDAQGRYRLARVPVGFTFKVVAVAKTADGKDVALQTIAKPTAAGEAEVAVSAATTMVAETVAEGREGLLGTFDPATFAEAVAEIKANMTDDERPTDWSDRAAIRTQMRKLAKRLTRVQQAVDELRVDLAKASARAADLEAALETLRLASPEPGVAPGAPTTPAPAGSGSPAVTRSAAPTAGPSPMAVTVVAAATAGLVGARHLAFDPSGTLFVADQAADRMRTLDVATGTFLTYLDARTSLFPGVNGVAFDAQGNLYASVRGDRDKILKITPDGRSSTLAGGTAGYVDGAGADARFRQPGGLAVDATGNVYVADMGNHCVRVIAPDGHTRTLAGKAEAGAADGSAADARFNAPTSLALDARGGVFVADTGNHRIRRITPEGLVKTIAGSERGLRDGAALRAAFDRPAGLIVEPGHLLVADSGNGRIRRVALTTDEVTTLPLGDTLKAPFGLAKDARGRIWVSDSQTHQVIRFQP